MKKNTIKLVGTTAAVLLLVTGCGKVPKLENGQDAVITLSGKNISVDTLYGEMKDRYALSILLDLMDTEILDQKYEDTDEIKKEIDDQVSLMVKQYGKGSEATLLQQTYSAWGIDNMDDLKAYLKLQYKRNKAVEDYAKSKVTDKEINKSYEEDIFGDISAKHILISPEVTSSMTDAEKKAAEEAALKEANEIISKLKNGEDFSELAKKYSDDESTASNGGTLADFAHGSMLSEFEEAAKKLEVGKYTTTPVKTSYGYHIILKVSQKDKPSLDTVKEDIIEELASDKLNSDATLQITALEELRKDYKVEIQDDTLKSQYETYLKNAKENAKNSNNN
ncbi:MAG: peptidylprolyl isomerase [Tenericutes bacterium]|nr:peptidylprolyl isomerase [Mycoplasmatota bacterium]